MGSSPFWVALALGLALPARPAMGQATPPEPPRGLDAEVVYFTLSWVWPASDAFALGPELGGGILEQKTLAPDGDDFTSIIHAGLVGRIRLSPALSAELGVRLGASELRSISCSGCAPDGFAAGTVALFTGSRRWRFGTRYMFGAVDGEPFQAWSPLVLRLRF